MDHWQCESLIKDHNYIQVKIKELVAFINSNSFSIQPIENQYLILKQLKIMNHHKMILSERIDFVCKINYNNNMLNINEKVMFEEDLWDERILGADEEFAQVAPYSQELEDVINAMVEYYKCKQ